MLSSRQGHALLARALDALGPRRCVACDLLGVTSPFCQGCESLLASWHRVEPQAACLGDWPLLSLGPFEPPLAEAIRRLKYQGRTDLARPLAELFWQRNAQAFGQAFGSHSALTLVPVPLHPLRLVTRGYNQSALFANALARLAGSDTAPRLLRRVRATAAQARLGKQARAGNLDGAFATRRPKGISGSRRWLLVDDVVTTGATLTACATALEQAGLHVVGICAIAHTPHKPAPR